MTTLMDKHGVTLLEMLIVLAVIAMLATMAIGIASRIDAKAKEKCLESIFTLLEASLEEYRAFKDGFPVQLDKNYDNVAAHSEYVCQELRSIPDSRNVLDKINDSFIQNKFGTADTPPEIYDPWGTVLDYRYVAGDNFPEMVSAGPDRVFGNADDISSR